MYIFSLCYGVKQVANLVSTTKKETTDIIISYIFANLIFNYLLFLPHKLWVDHAGHPSTYLQSEKKLHPTGEFKPGSPDTKTSILPARQR